MGAKKEQQEVAGEGISPRRQASEDVDAQVDVEWSVESVDRSGKPSHFKELLKKRKQQQQEQEAIVGDGSSSANPIAVYHRTLFRFKLSCRSSAPDSSSSSSSSRSLRQLFKKERDLDCELWWKKAMRSTLQLFKLFSPRSVASRMQRCCKSSADCCAAGLDYKGFSSSGANGTQRRAGSDEDAAEKLAIQNFFAAPLDSVRAARPLDSSREQCGWIQEYSPSHFSWESTPFYFSHQLPPPPQQQQPQQQPARSTASTAVPESVYSSNLMTPFEINHSFRRPVEDSRPPSQLSA
ncbi:hypothetical protein MPTK1_8g03160 [Marchantia polymorpha subsp. ruderalis]|nr:hypothetical protein MARPO_0012s0109 [Marchantia polymorpha]BBN18522.1 hypothetical protein Mp_8g03160 [Marchantia polymorpha subsp. ruderalis]|eukprot:PTQ46166.1 hypothetical protein MARPO_0012s0109 [Marchantia polymorpha]